VSRVAYHDFFYSRVAHIKNKFSCRVSRVAYHNFFDSRVAHKNKNTRVSRVACRVSRVSRVAYRNVSEIFMNVTPCLPFMGKFSNILFCIRFGFCGTCYHGLYRSAAFFISQNNWISNIFVVQVECRRVNLKKI